MMEKTLKEKATLSTILYLYLYLSFFSEMTNLGVGLTSTFSVVPSMKHYTLQLHVAPLTHRCRIEVFGGL